MDCLKAGECGKVGHGVTLSMGGNGCIDKHASSWRPGRNVRWVLSTEGGDSGRGTMGACGRDGGGHVEGVNKGHVDCCMYEETEKGICR